MNSKQLEGQVAIVTGGSRGIGQAICRALANEGANVVVADINMEGAEATAGEIRKHGGLAQAWSVDVASEKSVKECYSRLKAEFSRISILVNNAGICRMLPILDIEVEEWDKILAVNLRGTFLMSREAFRMMRDQRVGCIVNIASAAAKIGGLAAGAHYSASKAGVICFTKSLALQAAPFTINVNAVCPGPMATEMTDAWGEEANEAFKAKIPFKDYGKPEDVAAAVVFLVSSGARYITGEILDVNGGLVMD